MRSIVCATRIAYTSARIVMHAYASRTERDKGTRSIRSGSCVASFSPFLFHVSSINDLFPLDLFFFRFFYFFFLSSYFGGVTTHVISHDEKEVRVKGRNGYAVIDRLRSGQSKMARHPNAARIARKAIGGIR